MFLLSSSVGGTLEEKGFVSFVFLWDEEVDYWFSFDLLGLPTTDLSHSLAMGLISWKSRF
jgi:hypothetical protein